MHLNAYYVLDALLMEIWQQKKKRKTTKKTDKVLVLMEKTGEGKQRNKNFLQDWCSKENEVR